MEQFAAALRWMAGTEISLDTQLAVPQHCRALKK
jgi:hypothetical protein